MEKAFPNISLLWRAYEETLESEIQLETSFDREAVALIRECYIRLNTGMRFRTGIECNAILLRSVESEVSLKKQVEEQVQDLVPEKENLQSIVNDLQNCQNNLGNGKKACRLI